MDCTRSLGPHCFRAVEIEKDHSATAAFSKRVLYWLVLGIGKRVKCIKAWLARADGSVNTTEEELLDGNTHLSVEEEEES